MKGAAPIGAQGSNPNPDLIGYLAALEQRNAPKSAPGAANALEALDIDRLKQHRLVNKTTRDSWPLFQCLEGEIEYEGKTYHFSEGLFL